MAFVKIWIHAVWATKYRERILSRQERILLFQHIRENAEKKDIYVDFVNGVEDHVHCLLRLNADMPISKAIQLIKGESSYWANKEQLFRKKLHWADEYFAVSVSESHIERVRNYIRNQEEHHRKKTFMVEYEEFITNYGFHVDSGLKPLSSDEDTPSTPA
ncbi:MAG: IS200/IS605 family transposase [Runella sp.]